MESRWKEIQDKIPMGMATGGMGIMALHLDEQTGHDQTVAV